MKNRMKPDDWIYGIVAVLELIVAARAVGIIILTLICQPVPEVIVVLGLVAASGLAILLIPTPFK